MPAWTLASSTPASSRPSSAAASECEPSVAGGTDGTRVVAWMNYPASVGMYQVAYKVSHDEGATFGDVQAAQTPDGLWARSPVLAHGPDGLWLAWPGIHLAGQVRDDVRILASHLAYGADTFDAPVVLDDGTMQVRYGPSIAVLDDGALIAAYADNSGVTVSRRDPMGTVTQAALTELNPPSLCSNGTRVYAVFGNNNGIVLHFSDDEGRTWPTTQQQTVASDADIADAQPACAASGSTVWVVYGASTEPSTGGQPLLDAVRLVRSTDNAMTFTAPVDIKPPSMPLAMLPNITAAGNEAYIGFYAGSSSNDALGAAVVVRGSDVFNAWGYMQFPLLFSAVRTPPRWAGDSLGVSATGTRVDFAYASVGTSSTHVGMYGLEGAALVAQ